MAPWDEGEAKPKAFLRSRRKDVNKLPGEEHRAGSTCAPSPARPPRGTHDLRHDEEPGQGAEELAVVGEAAAGGGEVLGERAGGGGDRLRAGALRLLHRRARAGSAGPASETPGASRRAARLRAPGHRPVGGRGARRRRDGARGGRLPGPCGRGASLESARRPPLLGERGLSGCARAPRQETRRGGSRRRPREAAEARRRRGRGEGRARGGRGGTAPRRRRRPAVASPVARPGGCGGAGSAEGGLGSRPPAARLSQAPPPGGESPLTCLFPPGGGRPAARGPPGRARPPGRVAKGMEGWAGRSLQVAKEWLELRPGRTLDPNEIDVWLPGRSGRSFSPCRRGSRRSRAGFPAPPAGNNLRNQLHRRAWKARRFQALSEARSRGCMETAPGP